MVKMSRILSLDTSNYTTSACVFDTQCGIVWENRIMLPVKEGECGVRQNDAVFLHTKNLPFLFKDIDCFDIDFVAASCCPSERENSYMPCFTVGTSLAASLSSILKKEYYYCSHQKNHILSALYSANKTVLLNRRFLAYHISGGTTDICLCTPSESGVFSVKKIGGTADISCGQLIDRTGVSLDLPFPCGKHIEKIACGNISGKIRIKNNDGFYNFSGFQNKTQQMLHNNCEKNEIASYTLDVVYSFIMDSVKYFRNKFGDLPVIMSGGVMSNKQISNSVLTNSESVYFSDPRYSVDNALGTALMCAYDKGLLNG